MRKKHSKVDEENNLNKIYKLPSSNTNAQHNQNNNATKNENKLKQIYDTTYK